MATTVAGGAARACGAVGTRVGSATAGGAGGLRGGESVQEVIMQLARLLWGRSADRERDGQLVVISGAGLSKSSRIPTFRGDNDSVWTRQVTELGTRRAFQRDPLHWYNSFWLPHFPMAYTEREPTQGHEAIAALAADCSQGSVRVITQNVDNLHQRTRIRWPCDGNHLIEVHGSLGLYKCSDTTCVYGHAQSIPEDRFPDAVQAGLRAGQLQDGTPRCPECNADCMPQALMFDETYESHAFYAVEKALSWLESASAIVFCGTSFSVGLTHHALAIATERYIPVFNINILPNLDASQAVSSRLRSELYGGDLDAFPFHNLVGTTDSVLDALVKVRAALTMLPAPEAEAEAEIEIEEAGLGTAAAIAVADRSSHPALAQYLFQTGAVASPTAKWTSDVFDSDLFRGADLMHGLVQPQQQQQQLLRHGGGGGGDDSGDSATVSVHVPPVGTRCFFTGVPQRPVAQAECCAEFRHAFDRVPHPNPAIEGLIMERWEELRSQRGDAAMFNLSKFRLCEAICNSDTDVAASSSSSSSSSTSSSAVVRFRLGLTDYATYMGTTTIPYLAAVSPALVRGVSASSSAELRVDDAGSVMTELQRLVVHRGPGSAYLSLKMGISVVVQTSDGYLALLRRSDKVAIARGRVDVPGGHPEPTCVDGAAEDSAPETADPDLNARVLAQVFESARAEVKAEVNVHDSDILFAPLYLGASHSVSLWGTPSLAFWVRLSVDAEQLRRQYREGASEGWESSELILIPETEFFPTNGVQEAADAVLSRLGYACADHGAGAIALWRHHMLALPSLSSFVEGAERT